MGRGYKNLRMVTFIKGSIVRESHQVLDNIIVVMEATLKVNLKQD